MPQELLIDLAANELCLVGLFLAAADSASRHLDEDSKAESLKKAFVTYCQATLQISQLPLEKRDLLSSTLIQMRERLQAAYSEES